MKLRGIVGAMAYQFDGERLRIVLFNPTDSFISSLEKKEIKLRKFETYSETKKRRASEARALYARRKQVSREGT